MSQLIFFTTRDDTISILNALIETNEVEVFIGRSFEHEKPQPIGKATPSIEFDQFTLWLKNEFKVAA